MLAGRYQIAVGAVGAWTILHLAGLVGVRVALVAAFSVRDHLFADGGEGADYAGSDDPPGALRIENRMGQAELLSKRDDHPDLQPPCVALRHARSEQPQAS